MYKEYNALNYKSARPINPTFPVYHGYVYSPLSTTGAASRASSGKNSMKDLYKIKKALDPVTQLGQKINKKFIDEWYATGGSVIRTEIPVKSTTSGELYNHILLDAEHFRVGKLANELLHWHPGYSFRFMDNPWYSGYYTKPTIDGKISQKRVFQPVRTAGSWAQATVWTRKAQRASDNAVDGINQIPKEWVVLPAKDITRTENAFYQRQVWQEEGRYMYDQRNFDVLPDVNMNRTPLEDPSIAVDRGIHMVARDLGSNVTRAAKEAWHNQYGDLLFGRQASRLARTESPKELISKIKEQMKTAEIRHDTDALRVRKEALEYLQYFRLIDGTLGDPTAYIRRGLMNSAIGMEKFWMGKPPVLIPTPDSITPVRFGDFSEGAWRGYYNWAAEADPMLAAKQVNFNLFMKLRPIRQATLQGMQPIFLAGIDPSYVMTLKWTKDAGALLMGQANFRKAKTVPITTKGLAQTMGLSTKEFRLLAKRLDETGLTDVIDQVDFTGSLLRETNKPVKLPISGNPISGARYVVQSMGYTVAEIAGTGFRAGESVNVAGTYMVAIRKYMKEKYNIPRAQFAGGLGKHKQKMLVKDDDRVMSILELTQGDWDNIATMTHNLSMAMTKANNMPYQHGLMSMATQFMSFQHKTMLALAGKNPAISGAEARRMWASGFTIYGADFIRISKYVAASLAALNIDWADKEVIPEIGLTFEDVIVDGMLHNVVNGVGNLADPDWKDVDLEFAAPGPDTETYWDLIMSIITADDSGKVFGPLIDPLLGPTANVAGNFMEGLALAQSFSLGAGDMPTGELLLHQLDLLTREVIPAMSDAQQAHLWNRHGLYVSQNGQMQDLEVAKNQVWAKRLLGVDPASLGGYYDTFEHVYNTKEGYNSLVESTAKAIQKLMLLKFEGKISYESLQFQSRMIFSMWDDIPVDRKRDFRMDVMLFRDISVEAGEVQTIANYLLDTIKTGVDLAPVYHHLDDMLRESSKSPDEIEELRETIKDVYSRHAENDEQVYQNFKEEIEMMDRREDK